VAEHGLDSMGPLRSWQTGRQADRRHASDIVCRGMSPIRLHQPLSRCKGRTSTLVVWFVPLVMINRPVVVFAAQYAMRQAPCLWFKSVQHDHRASSATGIEIQSRGNHGLPSPSVARALYNGVSEIVATRCTISGCLWMLRTIGWRSHISQRSRSHPMPVQR